MQTKQPTTNWTVSYTSTISHQTNSKSMDLVAATKFDVVFLYVVFVLSLATNGFLVGKIITDRRLQTSINFLLMIHNVLNILLCFLTLLPAAVILTSKPTSINSTLCHVGASGYLLVNYLSIANLATIAVDRWRTISSSKYTLVVKQIVRAQVIYLLAACCLALPWAHWFNKNSLVEFSPGFLKCRLVHTSGTQSNTIVALFIFIRYFIFMVIPTIVISFCFIKIFNKVRGGWNSVGPMIHAPDGIPVGCYLKSAYTNALLISGFALLRFPELIYIGADNTTSGNATGVFYGQRFVAYITWVESVLFPFVCIMRNTTLLRRVTSLACCLVFLSKKDKRKKQYQVDQTNSINGWISTPSQISSETVTTMSGSISTVRTSSPAWSRISSARAWTVDKPVTASE